jgi:hypothetical protein
VNKKSIGVSIQVKNSVNIRNVEPKLEESVGAKYSSIHLKLKEVYREVRESCIKSIRWSELISQPIDQLDIIN